MPSDKNEQKRRVIISAVSGTLIAALYGMIFSFSAQNGEQSGSFSSYVTEKCVELIDFITGRQWSENFISGLVQYFEHPVRKMAHFIEYAVLGSLIFIFLSQWMAREKRLYLSVGIWVLLSAVSDELHQFFVPGRWSSPADVILDTCGGLFGMACLVLLGRWRRKKAEH